MAGEAGRGFAVVADEVQRLAERAANATKQIEVLVRTIQADTNEAVVSMERSTTDVVGGALLAENAGAALEEIEQVSNQIASLVQNISGQRAPAVAVRPEHHAQHAGAARDQRADRRFHHGHVAGDREARGAVGGLRKSVSGLPAAGPRRCAGRDRSAGDARGVGPSSASPRAAAG
jgi:hypothetical protein